MEKLTKKQAGFVREYAKDFNATQAAIRGGYTQRRASALGWQLLQKPTVQQALTKHLQSVIKKDVVDVDRVVSELATIAFANMADYASWSEDGVSLVSSDDLTREQTAAVKEVDEDRTEYYDSDGNLQVKRKIKFKLHDKTAALGKLEKYLELGQMGMIPWPDVLDALAEMARVVEMYVTDPDTIAKIKEHWSRIPIRPQRVIANGAS